MGSKLHLTSIKKSKGKKTTEAKQLKISRDKDSDVRLLEKKRQLRDYVYLTESASSSSSSSYHEEQRQKLRRVQRLWPYKGENVSGVPLLENA